MTRWCSVTVPIVDAHHHLWDLRALRYPWLTQPASDRGVTGDIEPLRRNYLLDDYLGDAAGCDVVRSVHVQAACDPADTVAETRWLQAIADTHGYPHGIVAYVGLHLPDAAEVIHAHRQHQNIRGVRQLVNWHDDPALRQTDRPDYLTDPAWRRGFSLLARHGLSFDLQTYSSQMADAAALAAEFPEIQLILNHTGMPVDQTEAGLAVWLEGMHRLAEQPNVAVKISGLGMFTDTPEPLITQTIDVFGPDRCMFASNFPVDRLYSSYATLVETFTHAIRDYRPSEQQAMLHDNAVRLYRL